MLEDQSFKKDEKEFAEATVIFNDGDTSKELYFVEKVEISKKVYDEVQIQKNLIIDRFNIH